MDESEEPTSGICERSSLLPRLLFGLAVIYVVLGLLAAWHEARGAIQPDVVLRSLALCLGGLALVFLGAFAGARRVPMQETQPEAWLCQHCLKPYVPGAHFCPRCSAPKTFFSGTGEYERVYAGAWLLGKAAWYPSRPLHLVGMVLIGGPAVLSTLLIVAELIRTTIGFEPLEGMLLSYLVHFSITGSLWGALLLICGVQCLHRARGKEPRRPEIDYGAPPWFSYDTQWALPEFEEEPEDDEGASTPVAG